uniref:Uncharacterized protein n=1 Tax=Strongyloides papillosus TaxID=174720 RepID=A0A0N5CIW6_STREA
MPPAGVEPATLGLLDPRSNRLSYGGLPMRSRNCSTEKSSKSHCMTIFFQISFIK